jgi:tetratricopeptide (TPR) repeat protein
VDDALSLEPRTDLIVDERVSGISGIDGLEHIAKFSSYLDSFQTYQRVRTLVDANNFDGAIAELEELAWRGGKTSGIAADMAYCWRHKGEPEKAAALYVEAIGLGQKDSENPPLALSMLFANYATALIDQGDMDGAVRACLVSLNVMPNPLAVWNFSCAALTAEQYEAAWKVFHVRRNVPGYTAGIDYGVPEWTGVEKCERLMLVGEQGIGERVLFASLFADAAAASGAQLQIELLEQTIKLRPLMERSFPGHRVVTLGDSMLAPGTMQTLMGDLARFFRPTAASFPKPKAYLVPDAERMLGFREIVRAISPDNRVIGLSWRSINREFGHFKSCRLIDLAPILSLPGVTFVSVQYGDVDEEIAEVKEQMGVTVHKMPGLDLYNDVDGAAALIAACDHIVTVSNINAHLAGALGVPSSLMLGARFGRVWYWGLKREDSAWYPDMRIFRREGAEPWSRMIDQVAEYIGGLDGRADSRAGG